MLFPLAQFSFGVSFVNISHSLLQLQVYVAFHFRLRSARAIFLSPERCKFSPSFLLRLRMITEAIRSRANSFCTERRKEQQ